MMNRKILLTLLLACWALLGGAALADACSVCVNGAGDPTADAFNWSVLFLMATPYTVVGSIAGWLFYKHRCADAKPNQDAGREPVIDLAWNEKESAR